MRTLILLAALILPLQGCVAILLTSVALGCTIELVDGYIDRYGDCYKPGGRIKHPKTPRYYKHCRETFTPLSERNQCLSDHAINNQDHHEG